MTKFVVGDIVRIQECCLDRTRYVKDNICRVIGLVYGKEHLHVERIDGEPFSTAYPTMHTNAEFFEHAAVTLRDRISLDLLAES